MKNQFRSLRTKSDKSLHRLVEEGAANKKQVKNRTDKTGKTQIHRSRKFL